MTPEEICTLIQMSPEVFSDMFEESLTDGVEHSATICAEPDKIHLEDRCYGEDDCSVELSSMKCKSGEPVAHVHTHIQEDNPYYDRLSLTDITGWLTNDFGVECLSHKDGINCFTSPGNPSIKGASKVCTEFQGKKLTKNVMRKINSEIDKLPDVRTGRIYLRDLYNDNKTDPKLTKVPFWTGKEYFEALEYLNKVSEIKPCLKDRPRRK